MTHGVKFRQILHVFLITYPDSMGVQQLLLLNTAPSASDQVRIGSAQGCFGLRAVSGSGLFRAQGCFELRAVSSVFAGFSERNIWPPLFHKR